VALESSIQGLHEEVAMLQSSLRGGVFVDPTAPPAEVVNELEQALARIDHLEVLPFVSCTSFVIST
jgi:hypothetical protein